MSDPASRQLEPVEERSSVGILRRLFTAAVETRPSALSCTLRFRSFDEVEAFGRAVSDLTTADGEKPRMTLVLREDSVVCTLTDGARPDVGSEAAELSGRRHDPDLLQRARQRLERVAAALRRRDSVVVEVA